MVYEEVIHLNSRLWWSVSNVTVITYANLLTAISWSTLKVWQWYLITDYQTVHYVQYTYTSTPKTDESINYGIIEPLLVYAVASNKLDFNAISTVYPTDIIYRKPTFSAWEKDAHTDSKWLIYYRQDEKGDARNYDWRTYVYYRWNDSTAKPGIPSTYYTSATPISWATYQAYKSFDVVNYTRNTQVSGTHTTYDTDNVVFYDSVYDTKVIWFNNTFWSTVSSVATNVNNVSVYGSVLTSTLQDVSTSILPTLQKSTITSCNTIYAWVITSNITVSTWLGNSTDPWILYIQNWSEVKWVTWFTISTTISNRVNFFDSSKIQSWSITFANTSRWITLFGTDFKVFNATINNLDVKNHSFLFAFYLNSLTPPVDIWAWAPSASVYDISWQNVLVTYASLVPNYVAF